MPLGISYPALLSLLDENFIFRGSVDLPFRVVTSYVLSGSIFSLVNPLLCVSIVQLIIILVFVRPHDDWYRFVLN